MSKLVWTENYNVHRARIGAFTIVIDWDGSGWRVSFCDRGAKARPRDLSEAKALGIEFARQILTKALASLSDPSG